jgi:phosphohistidine phosphatase
MLRLLLLRHAKSDWSDAGLGDHDRPLAPRGLKAASLMGAAIPVTTLAALYDFGSGREVSAVIAAHGGSASPLLVVGHNPAFHALAVRMVADGARAAMAELKRKFPTGALAVIDVPIEAWADLPGAGGKLVAFIRPKAINDDS